MTALEPLQRRLFLSQIQLFAFLKDCHEFRARIAPLFTRASPALAPMLITGMAGCPRDCAPPNTIGID
ncbi:MAG: hypothetical protein CTY31_06945 [Hyphomicrobium sp.]|nr:MAG: hypothetical protein CTY39_02060 [Hyphomicrobium sp.]PPC99649.1 MAG: hypothetical protein CTY31_06945 [Hyphomicrobium sp.]